MKIIATLCRFAGGVLFGLLLSLPTWAADAPAPKPDFNAAKVFRLLDASGYEYTKKSDTVWYIVKHGDHLGDFKVIGANEGDLLVVFVTVAQKAHIQMDLDLASKMLSLNNDLDQVKIGIDNDGDAFVRTDISIRILDKEAFKAVIEQVAAAAEETYAAMKPYTDYQ
ncbi:MAG TPA: YbjN domain-containing protein [Gammaproteobacteria bacterium]|nr:YbjN domain-containing protein [Gammaproteobacteria bacterium]